MPFKRNITHSDGLNFWQCICSGVIRLIRLAWNVAAVISDLSVLRGGMEWHGRIACDFIATALGKWFRLVSVTAALSGKW